MISLDDWIAIIKRKFLCLKEIIWIVEVDSGTPSFLQCILVTTGCWVMSYKNALLWQSFYTSLLGILCYTPCKIVHIFLEELPSTTKVLCDIQFFVNFAWIISEFTAIGPGSSKSPLLLSGVELELVNLFARVETSNLCSTVFSYPVNSMSAYL